MIERGLWLWSWATVGLCCRHEKTTQCETKNTVGSNSFGELTLCFDIWQSIAFRPSHGYEIRKKERKLFPIIKDVKTTFVKHSERNFCLYLPLQNFDKFMQTKTKHNETKQAKNKIPPSFNLIYTVSKVMAVENKIRYQGLKWYNQKPHFLQWWSDNYGIVYNITVINVIRVETFMTVVTLKSS